MEDKKAVWSIMAMIIILLVILIIVVHNKNKSESENYKLKEEEISISNKQVNKNNQEKSMNQQIPEEINMDLAKTCLGAKIKTNQGTVQVKFYNDQTPTTVANFCTLAKDNFYDGIRFHRVIRDFMIQAGDPNSKDIVKKNSWGMGGPGYKFEDELPNVGEYKLGSLAMANSGPNTNGSQFFIVSGQAGVQLPPLYSLFGEVVEGMEIVEMIQNVETGARDIPVEDVIIENIEVLEK